MRIAFFIDNQYHLNVDYSKPENGNPGIGGTHYMFWSVACYLKKLYPELEIYIIAPIISTMPLFIKAIQGNDEMSAVEIAKKNVCDFLVLRGPKSDTKLFQTINEYKQKVIFWTHNFEDLRFADLVYRNKYVMRNVCVGKEQLDRLRDHPVFGKNCYIYNALDCRLYFPYTYFGKKENIVSYMGALTPRKGFHALAMHWKDIKTRCPDAKLYILGGKDLYFKNESKDVKLSSYEKRCIRYLSNKDGTLIEGVTFWGVVSGEKKLKLLADTKVGVPNPTAVGETFCIVAAEFEAVGTPVVTINKNGFLDSVVNHETGLLFKTRKQFVHYVVELLENDQLNMTFGLSGKQHVQNNFTIEKICEQWYKLFREVEKNEIVQVTYKADNWYNNLKWLREINRRIKKIPFLSWAPSLLWYEQIAHDIYVFIRDNVLRKGRQR